MPALSAPPVTFNMPTILAITYTLGRAEHDPGILPRLFAKLVEPDVDPEIVQNYCGAIAKSFVTSGEDQFGEPTAMGFDGFQRRCLDAGLVVTMLKITQNQRPDPRCSIAAYHALDGLMELIQRGTLAERRGLRDQLLAGGVLEVCFTKLADPLCLHRSLAVKTLRALATSGFLGEKLSPAQASEIIVAMARYTLAGPEAFVSEMRAETTTWQSAMFMGSKGIPTSRSAKYVPRYYAMSQESAMWTAHGLLCRDPPPKKSFCLEIVQKNPEIFDLLLQCAALPRSPWYPETEADSIASEVFCCLFQCPLDVVPGITTSYEDATMKAEAAAEWQAMVQIIRIFVSRPGWVEALVAVGAKVNNEKVDTIRLMFDQVKRKYLAQELPDTEIFLQSFRHRGTLRIAILRVIATMSYAAEACKIDDASLVSLLRMAYLCSAKIVPFNEINANDLAAQYAWLERTQEIYRSPMYIDEADFGVSIIEAPLQSSPESIIGPTALIRLLTLLTQRGALPIVALPLGTSPSTSLSHAVQITSAPIVRQCVALARKRLPARRAEGKKRWTKEREADYACAAHTGAAELAAALCVFDAATEGTYAGEMSGVHEELVRCLGEAAQMALEMGYWRKALNLAGCAVADGASLGGALNASLRSKNLQRVEAAKSKLNLPDLKMHTKLSLPNTVATISKPWTPKMIAAVNNHEVKVAKIKGAFIWHSHPNSDELFYVLDGSLQLELENLDTVVMDKGDVFVVPRGLRHKPISEAGAEILLIEMEGTINTGDAESSDLTVIPEDVRKGSV
ncbi:hypothetical protein HWV62_43581 [Athelia sp. TMB]|nr:hypothetical protein HWV62_43581 [Athelia sp. TMB]